jgi:hypothetical protein
MAQTDPLAAVELRAANGRNAAIAVIEPTRVNWRYRPRLCKNNRQRFWLSDDGVADLGGLVPTLSRSGARHQQWFSFVGE